MNWYIKITNSFIKYMHCFPSLLNIMFLCLVEVPISAKNNNEIFKVSTDVTTEITIKTLVLSSTKDHI